MTRQRGVVIGVTIIGAALAFVFAVHLLDAARVAAGSAAPAGTPDVISVATREPTVLDAPTLREAFRYARTRFGQKEMNKHSTGSDTIVTWATSRMTWADVAVAEDETSYGLAMKDIDAARGRRLCFGGTLVQIAKDTSGASPIFDGIMMSDAGNFFAFAAVGSSGSLIKGSYARICAVVTDRYDYSNTGGGQTQAVDIVGMFDLPANKPPAPVATPQAPPAPTVDCSEPFVMSSAGKLAFKKGCEK